jgi:hypothetical protein
MWVESNFPLESMVPHMIPDHGTKVMDYMTIAVILDHCPSQSAIVSGEQTGEDKRGRC